MRIKFPCMNCVDEEKDIHTTRPILDFWESPDERSITQHQRWKLYIKLNPCTSTKTEENQP